jgi:uncharacterized protein YchJ
MATKWNLSRKRSPKNPATQSFLWRYKNNHDKKENSCQISATNHASHTPMKSGRNDPCPCGSGKKYKQCCLQAREAQQAEDFLWHQIAVQ